ncbi:MAG: hypothetical protein M3Q24_00345 [bacterium]|nr:hypothetical protein [bacterium]
MFKLKKIRFGALFLGLFFAFGLSGMEAEAAFFDSLLQKTSIIKIDEPIEVKTEPIVKNPNSCQFKWQENLKVGSVGDGVLKLQILLNSDPETALEIKEKEAGSKGFESKYFGKATERAVIKFQEKYRKEILDTFNVNQNGTGFVGPLTRSKLNTLCGNEGVSLGGFKIIETPNQKELTNVEVSRVSATPNISLFSFDIVSSGQALVINELPITLHTEKSSNAAVTKKLELYQGERIIGTKSITSNQGTSTVTFGDLNINILENGKETFTVKATIGSIRAGGFSEGDFAQIIVNGSDIKATDGAGNNILGSRLTSSGRTVFRTKGISVEFLDSKELFTKDEDSGNSGVFTMQYKVTSFGADSLIVNNVTSDTDGINEMGDGNVFTTTGTSTIRASGLTSTAENKAKSFLVKKDTTETFTLTVVKTGGGFSQVRLMAIEYTPTNSSSGVFYKSNLEDFETNPLYLEAN